ncbi:hypothetical protein EIP91_010922 [Steccherinum ochraceum]|uniref:FAD-binding PCMH-type domain-containing protein n=1 Tax=Steccherinum ochraceum TaxID=92696 RepID=A0A4R0RBZ3_9APHY|nr:hypothetical protein EIP91_010922 [Steccherinum ochraceum]
MHFPTLGALVTVAVAGFGALRGGSAQDLVLEDSTLDATLVHGNSVIFACQQISKSISHASAVYYPHDATGHYAADISHYASSSMQNATCSVEPGTPQDVGIILQILGKTKTAFGVKGGGHSTNPSFSSTTGVQIALTRFNQTTYNAHSQTADVGTGLIWDDVYASLEPHGVIVLGGRVSGVGVAGYSLGGGYAWQTNQYGLSLDTIEAYELVLPNGVVTHVTAESNPDLFFGLRGGHNNFGIVTKITFKTFPQGQIWGGAILVSGEYIDQVKNATLKFANVTDTKAAVIPSFVYAPAAGGLLSSILLFYDGLTPPAGIFDDFLAIPYWIQDVSTRSIVSLIQSSNVSSTIGLRGFYHTVPNEFYDDNFLTAVINDTTFYGDKLFTVMNTSLVTWSWSIEPFQRNILSHGSPSAYPSQRSKRFLPTNLYIGYAGKQYDDVVLDSLRASVANMNRVAKEGGQNIDDAPLYGNYALFDTPVEKIYRENLPRLQRIKKVYDPENDMGLTGGWKI